MFYSKDEGNMHKLTGIVFALILLAIAIYLVMLGQLSGGVISCHSANTISFDELEFRTRASGWDKSVICRYKQDAIITLEGCLADTASKSPLPPQLHLPLMTILPVIRPDVQPLQTVKDRHDRECWEYPSTMFARES
jgi:hypothetical protein